MTDPAQATRERLELRWFVLLFAAYASASLVYHWLRAPLFLGVGVDGWVKPSLPELAYLVYMTCLPVFLWLLLAYAGASRMPGRTGLITLLVVLVLVLAAIELDSTWYSMSGHHATWREVRLFLSEDRTLHYGLRASDADGFLFRMWKHLFRLVLILIGAGLLARWKAGESWFSIPFTRLLAVVVSLIVLDVLLAGLQITRGSDQWRAVADANFFRIHSVDRVSARLFSYASDRNEQLEAANRAFLNAVRDAGHLHADASAVFKDADQRAPLRHERYDVILVTIEGLNARLSDSTAMPFWSHLASRSTSLRNHYSTGNVTEYGVLGLLYGTAPNFYRGTSTLPWEPQVQIVKQPLPAGSPYLTELARRGYHTRLISWELSSWAQLGAYLHNFTEPAFESTNDWTLIPELSRELSKPGPHFVYMHYNGTHFPYEHALAYTRFRPEVSKNYDYTSGRVQSQALEITNRYRNCLVELDAWLHSLVTAVDLQHTIIVLTGDHGEEFFEHSRLGHASTLDAPQIHTPAIIYVPGQPPRVIDAVTSHADVMPTLMEYLGLPQPIPPFGHSLAGDVKVGAAVVAMGNRPDPPVRWAAIAGGSKVVLAENENHVLSVVDLLDTADRKLSYTPDSARWQAPFAMAAQLQLRLAVADHATRVASTVGMAR